MKLWGKKKWSGFGKSARSERTYTNLAPSGDVLRIAEAAASGEYKNKSLVIAGRIMLKDQERNDGWWDLGAMRILTKKVR